MVRTAPRGTSVNLSCYGVAGTSARRTGPDARQGGQASQSASQQVGAEDLTQVSGTCLRIADWIEQHMKPSTANRPAFVDEKFAKGYYYSLEPSFIYLKEEDTYATARGPGFTECYDRYDGPTSGKFKIRTTPSGKLLSGLTYAVSNATVLYMGSARAQASRSRASRTTESRSPSPTRSSCRSAS